APKIAPELMAKLALVGPKLAAVGAAQVGGELQLVGELEAKVAEQTVDAGERELPTPILAGASLDRGHARERSVAVGLEHGFDPLDRSGPTVALELTLVAVELHLPDQPAVDERLAGLAQAGQQRTVNQRRFPAHAHAQVPVRIAVAQEVPALDPLPARFGDPRLDELEQDPIGERVSAVELDRQPLGAGHEVAPRLG